MNCEQSRLQNANIISKVHLDHKIAHFLFQVKLCSDPTELKKCLKNYTRRLPCQNKWDPRKDSQNSSVTKNLFSWFQS